MFSYAGFSIFAQIIIAYIPLPKENIKMYQNYCLGGIKDGSKK